MSDNFHKYILRNSQISFLKNNFWREIFLAGIEYCVAGVMEMAGVITAVVAVLVLTVFLINYSIVGTD